MMQPRYPGGGFYQGSFPRPKKHNVDKEHEIEAIKEEIKEKENEQL
jgi:hypothetical protein